MPRPVALRMTLPLPVAIAMSGWRIVCIVRKEIQYSMFHDGEGLREAPRHAKSGVDCAVSWHEKYLKRRWFIYGRPVHVHAALVCLLVCMVIEVGPFNLPYWSTGANSISTLSIDMDGQSVQGNDVAVSVNKDSGEPVCWSTDFDQPTSVDSVLFPLQAVDTILPNPKTMNGTFIQLTVFDEGSSQGISWPARFVHARVASSQLFAIHPSGKVTTLKLCITSPGVYGARLSAPAKVNVHVPFTLSPVRLGLYVILALILAFRSVMWVACTAVHGPARHRRLIWIGAGTAAVLLAIAAIVMGSWRMNTGAAWQADDEYRLYARSLIAGHPWLDYPVPDTLKAMSNPYDHTARDELGLVVGNKSLWNPDGSLGPGTNTALIDYAYFDGRYYSYFGLLPALLTYVPYRLFTGHDMANWKANFVATVLAAVLMIVFVRLIKRRFAPKAADVPFALLAVASSVGMQPAMYLGYQSGLYSVPIAWGLVFALAALVLWLRGSFVDHPVSRYALYMIGGLMAGLVVGCRPQMALVAFMLPAIACTTPHIMTGGWCKRFMSAMTASLAGATGFLVGATPFLAWNKVRFGAWLDFGSSYNLTGFDMTRSGLSLQRGVIGLITNLFATPQINGEFPFLHVQTYDSNSVNAYGSYQGVFAHEPVLGGLLFWVPVTLAVFFIAFRALRLRLHAEGLTIWVAFAILAALALMFIDAAMAAVAPRYTCDMAFLAVSAAIAVSTVLYVTPHDDESVGDSRRISVMRNVVALLSIVTIVLAPVSFVVEGRYDPLSGSQPFIYALLQSAFALS